MMMKLTHLWRHRTSVAIAMTLFMSVAANLVSQTPVAQAAGCPSGGVIGFGRSSFCGYFDNKYDDVGLRLFNNGTPANIAGPNNDPTALANFISFIENLRNSPNNQDQTSGEFIIDTMEGVKPPNNARGLAWTLQADWVSRMKNGIAAGILTIEWNHQINWSCGQVNTYYQVAQNDIAPYITSPVTQETPACGPGVTTAAIVFLNPKTNKPYYVIKRNCGNPIGNLAGLPSTPDFNINLTASSATQAPAHVIAGSVNSIAVKLDNTGPGASQPGHIQVEMPGGGVVNAPCAPVQCTPGTQTTLTNGDETNRGYRSTSPVPPMPAGLNWFWDVKSLGNGAATQGALQFTISAGAPPGNITFNVYYWYGNLANKVDHVTVTFDVVSERTPSVVGANGDIQAGGGIGVCQANAPGLVQGHAGAQSGGQYIVSASAAGGINDFVSNNGGANTLNLGSSGGYLQVCRKDLLSAAEQYVADGGGNFGTITAAQAANLNVATLNAFPVYFYTAGGTLHLHGVVGRSLTIVDEVGAVEITGNITITGGATAAHNVPSLGIIANGGINIDKAALLVDAYLFSDGTIDTCTEGQSSTTACDTAQLVINGFLMANKISFRRLGAFNVDGSPITEQVNLNPEIYLNPPMFFDASVDDNNLQGQGEQQPLY
jgi:hypothetical protein